MRITTVELNALLRGLVQLRDATHRTRGFEVRPGLESRSGLCRRRPLPTRRGAPATALHAEQVSRSVELSTRETGGMALLRFEFTNPENPGRTAALPQPAARPRRRTRRLG
jgi:hypothetical protein